MAKDPAVLNHQEWLGYVQPVGLVVSIPALIQANAFLNRNFGPEHQRFLAALPADRDGKPVPEIAEFPEFARWVLKWDLHDLYGSAEAPPVPDSLEAPLPEYHETLRPTWALHDFQPSDPNHPWILLIQQTPAGGDFDQVAPAEGHHWQASYQARFERLLRETEVPIGLLVNSHQIRLVYAPKGESSGYITFKLDEMVKVAGRPIFAALHMLLEEPRLCNMGEKERLPAILANSRKYQNVVSTKLAGQVLEALYDLLRGFQAADDQAHGDLLREVLARDPNHVYAGLLTILLRLVFLLYAEDKDLLSTDPVYRNHYSVTGLYNRLREDAGRYPDTMDQRYGAWAQLLALFRLVCRGGSHAGLRIPAREGYLFDPDRYLFLEGRQKSGDRPSIPRVADGYLFRVLSRLLVLDGERLSYRTLDVEQIGSVYEAIMGFELHVAQGQSVAIRPAKKNGAPATINLEELLRVSLGDRLKWFAERTDQKLSGQAAEALKSARTLEELTAALEKKIARAITPNAVPQGAMIFQPSDERRRSGSHYTPRSLTQPIVRDALRPVLQQLGEKPKPEQILNLKVCDPAMGSGAFLVEACRQLGDELMKAWHVHNCVPPLPPDENEILYAQRQIAQRCIYGVDKNPLAADLAKLSLWLATLAREHAFTFLDHSLRAGDSLVGLTRREIAAFNWNEGTGQQTFLEENIRKTIERVTKYRRQILDAVDQTPYANLRQQLDNADQALVWPRLAGGAVIAAFFSADKPKRREQARQKLQDEFEAALKRPGDVDLAKPIDVAVCRLRSGTKGIAPFHWEVEFPEVFTTDDKGRVTGGFDAIVGNPPFAGKNTISAGNSDLYIPWLQALHEQSNGNSDLVAHFFRRAFALLGPNGCFGLIATNTIGQGDTRFTGLRWICTHGGNIYNGRTRFKWPGQAAVVVSVVHVAKSPGPRPCLLNGRNVPIITAYLFHAGGHEDPARLRANADKSFIGSYVLGMGFTFDDTDRKGVATSTAEMRRLVESDPRNAERILPYIGGEEINTNPTHSHHRYVINFEDWPLRRERLEASWTDGNAEAHATWLRNGVVPVDYPGPVAADCLPLLDIVERKVKPERLTDNRENYRRFWWRFAERRPGLHAAINDLPRVLVISRVTERAGLTWMPSKTVFAETVVVFAHTEDAVFAVLQSQVHDVWARFFSSSLGLTLRYSPSDCFETFPLPTVYCDRTALKRNGAIYYRFRAELMCTRNKGLTALYNDFHDPDVDDPGIAHLRDLHDDMDRAVLDAYGWNDIQPKCEFIPEFENEEDEEDDGKPKKKRYRYRWPDEIRDEVLARLLELNRQRAMEEGQVVTPDPEPKPSAPKKPKPTKDKPPKASNPGLFA